ncbi:MAG TPA: molybdate ABC transporter substrate-binding protein, partial [Oceanobacillus sp.]|nr:molybdate ABC transporter substrate-binding protein [Oceanobacillus sp.]
MRSRLLILVVLFFAFSSRVMTAQRDQTLLVFAAASLTDAFEEIATAFEAENPGVDVLFNFAGSSALATQLVEGAPADVFASANTRQMRVAIEAGRIAEQPLVFARNWLVLITPADNPANIESLRDLANPGVKLVVAAPEVPVRVYTDVMLARLASVPTYGSAYRTAVLANIVSEEDNVRQVFLKVALG